MNTLTYVVTRLLMGLAALMSVDTIAETALAGDVKNVFAAATLIFVFELMTWDSR